MEDYTEDQGDTEDTPDMEEENKGVRIWKKCFPVATISSRWKPLVIGKQADLINVGPGGLLHINATSSSHLVLLLI